MTTSGRWRWKTAFRMVLSTCAPAVTSISNTAVPHRCCQTNSASKTMPSTHTTSLPNSDIDQASVSIVGELNCRTRLDAAASMCVVSCSRTSLASQAKTYTAPTPARKPSSTTRLKPARRSRSLAPTRLSQLCQPACDAAATLGSRRPWRSSAVADDILASNRTSRAPADAALKVNGNHRSILERHGSILRILGSQRRQRSPVLVTRSQQACHPVREHEAQLRPVFVVHVCYQRYSWVLQHVADAPQLHR